MRSLLKTLALACALLVVLVLPCMAQTPPRVVAGVLDLSEWDFAQGNVELAGEWRFDDGFLAQPGPWNKKRPELSALGRHTLSLTILLPSHAPALAISIPDINSAFTVHFNGAKMREVGRVADSEEAEVPVLERVTVPVPDGLRRLEMVVEVSNHHHFEGGIIRAVRIGPAALLSAEAQRLKAIPLVAFGALLMVVVLLPAFWLGGKREPVFLIFAAFSMLVAWRTFASGQLYTLLGRDLRADWWYLPAAYVSLYSFPGMYLGFLRALFPAEVKRWIAWPVMAICAVMTALVPLTEPAVYTRFRDPFQACILLVPLVGAVLLALALVRRRQGAGWVLVGSLLLTVTVVNDSLHYQRVINTTDLVPLGFAAFGLCYCAALALRLFQSERQASERLAALNRALEDKVAERTASLEEAKAAAEQASRAKSEFLAVMSHEIRTPLHGWAGLTELLEGTPLNDTQRHYVGLLRHTAAHLTKLIGDILDMSRIEAGRLELSPEPMALGRFIADLAELGRAQATAKGLEFRLEVGEGLPEAVAGDMGAIRQIVLNFLGNAAKFTSQGSVRLGVAPGENGIRFSVSDTGCGIPVGRQMEIFETFRQLDASSCRAHGGSGLGLAICRRLAELMGGRVGVASEPGRGTTIWCELPLPEAALPAAVEPKAARILPPGLRLLLADDAELNRLVLREFLTGTGAMIDEAADGAAALAKVEAVRYDLAVLDLRMPGVDGFQAARTIRERERRLGLPPLPLVALTAGASPADRAMAEEAGFTAFLAKPIDRPALIAALADLLSAQPPQAAAALPPPPHMPDGLEHMLPLFIAEMGKDAETLDGLRAASAADIAEHAHAMRGKCAMFGEDILYGLLTRLEQDCLGGNTADVDALVTSIIERALQLREYDANPVPVSQ